ncbi:hypothetical protein E1B28_013155 [Marasmius oreades]|uniref:Acyl-CoA oxidase n=1 Tax=Marasmius oreades TaxID=181124 RepID=A0A9P7RP54_9AGAR|nr:uncharacterized protein E1B28_013155 [Marasmius oreades]KAG7087174.1 hypothetical protein E1B28_013155 [Marasmius oreades]
MITPSSKLISTPLFQSASRDERLPSKDRLRLAHQRAKAISQSYDLSVRDILQCTEKFWDLHLDPLFVTDFSAWTFVVIQLNLAAGVIGYSSHQDNRHDLNYTLKRIIEFDVSSAFLMTELGHGLDAIHLETTATLLPNGNFDLHTPREEAQKYMAPTLPDVGVPRIGVVMARLSVDSQDYGVRPFLVPLNDGKSMFKGIIASRLPDRPGATPIGHALTHFNHVILPKEALLGPLKPEHSPRIQLLSDTWRVAIGTATVGALVIPVVKLVASIVGIYSKKRTIINSQHSTVLEAFYKSIRVHFDGASKYRTERLQIRSAYATLFKAIAIRLGKASIADLGDRCGAQGLFGFNQLITAEMTMRGVAIAEGDTLVLSIRLVFELLLERYSVSKPRNQQHPLAVHEVALIKELRSLLDMSKDMSLDRGGVRTREEAYSPEKVMPSKETSLDHLLEVMTPPEKHAHRSEFANTQILPRACSLVEAIGCRMAYEAASEVGIDPLLLDLFYFGCVERDLGWYVENRVMSRQTFFRDEQRAISGLLPSLETLIEKAGMKPYITAKICDEGGWKEFVDGLDVGDNTQISTRDPSRL